MVCLPQEQRGKVSGGARDKSVEAFPGQGGESGREQRGGSVLPLEGPTGHPMSPLAADQESRPSKITSSKFVLLKQIRSPAQSRVKPSLEKSSLGQLPPTHTKEEESWPLKGPRKAEVASANAPLG